MDSRSGYPDPSLGQEPKPTVVEPDVLRTVMGHFATGVAIVTGSDRGEPVGMTVQSLVSVSLNPPLLLFCPSSASASWPRIASGEVFAINILRSSQRDVCASFAKSGGDKFGGVRWRSGAGGAPLLDDALAYAECVLHAVHDAGDHRVVLGRVLNIASHETAHAATPLVFYRGAFASLVPT
ncbi:MULTISPECIES: flavin reductase family protein [unclassified Mycobacterium]|uniref:flavin reductase family protein n=1 Tax=unclassified Mycobacterium TaxID=2642494 RepID=UPI0029C91278|nr:MULTISPECIES: flavin reductase family protein [unclassified Mycobacterium]